MSNENGKQQSPKVAGNNQTGSGKPESTNQNADTTKGNDHLFKKNSAHEKLTILEADHKSLIDQILFEEKEVAEKEELLKPKNKFSEGKTLTLIAKKRLRSEVKKHKEKIKALNVEIRRIENLLKAIYKGIEDKISRANVKKAAKKEKYHDRYRESVKKRIDEVLEGMPAEKLTALKAEVPKAEFKTGNAIMMKALVNATRFLHTRVVSNPKAREEYLTHFRGKLTGSKGKSRKK